MTALLTPLEFGAARQMGATLYRKQLLPLGEISYKGRKIAFTRDYLSGLVQAFRDKAYDVVPLQFADAANAHTNAPEQRRGTVRDLQLTDDGLDVLVEVGPDAAEHLSKYPDLGVSARIVEGYDRADGKFFPAAVQHVLGTLDPRIPGMRPWQAVEAANDDAGETLDLTAIQYATEPPAPQDGPVKAPVAPEQEEAGMAFTADQEARLAKLLDLPEDQFAALFTPKAQAEDETAADDGADIEAGEGELTDAQLEQLLAEIDTETAAQAETEGDRELEPAGAVLANDAQAAIELANARAEEAMAEARRTRTQLDRATYERERDHYQRTYGIPARLTDLARPLLEGSGRTVDLANGASADAGAIVRKLIGEFGKTMQTLGIGIELGNAEGADTERQRAEDEATERTDFVAAYRNQHAL